MEHTYTSNQLVQAGKELVTTLIDECNSTNNISGFLKGYLNKLTAKDGIYHQQQIAMDKFAKSSTVIQEEAQTMMHTTQENGQQIQDMCTEFNELNDTVTKVQNGRETMDENVKALTGKIKEINSFVKNIREVSEQTKLLSFNASIEAARAGEAGKGFRIIANEVKRLSDSTTKLAGDIDAKMQELDKKVQDIVSENKSHNVIIDNLQKTAEASSVKLTKINEDSHKSLEFTERILSQMDSSHKEIMTATKIAENQNIQQVKEIASRAAENTIQTGDQLSFLFELNALFDWFSDHQELFAK